MRIYSSCYELMSELFREVWEMGHIVHPHSMQNKIVAGDDNYSTREIINYSYSLTGLNELSYLFFADQQAKKWADEEFKERISQEFTNPGKAWKLRNHIWEEFLNENGEFDYSYNERMGISLEYVIAELIANPSSRQGIIGIWDPFEDIEGIGGESRIPCSMYYQVLIRQGKVHLVYNQRSADIVTHFGNDVYLAWKLKNYIANRLNRKPGYLFHNIGSLHAYKKDWPILKRCINDIQKKK